MLSPSKKYRVKLTVVDINGNEHIYWKDMEPPTDTFISEQKIYSGVDYGPICDASAGDGVSIYLKMGYVMGDNASGYIVEMLSAPAGYDPTQPHPIAGQKMMAVGDEITLPNNYNSMYFYPTNYHPTTYKPATTATEDGRVNLPAGTYTFKISHICDPANSVTRSVTVQNFTLQRPTLNKHVTESTVAIEQQCINSKVYPFRGNGITDYVIDQNGNPMRVRMTFFVGGVEKSPFDFEPSLYSNPYHNYQNYSFEVPRAEVTIDVKYDAYVERDGSYEWCPLRTSEFTLANRHLNYEESDYFGYRCQDGTTGKIGIKAINGQGPYTYELRTSEGGSLVDQKASIQAGEKIVFDITQNAALSYYMTIKDEACPGEEYYETILLVDLGAPTVNPYAKKFCTDEPSISKDISPIDGVNGVIADGMMSYTWTIKTDNPNIQGLVANPTTPQAKVMSGALTLAPGITTPQIAVYKVMPTYGVCEGQPFEITLVVSPCINYWQGATDTDWNKTSNWTESTIPQTGEDVIFATEANNPYFKTIPNSGAAKNNLYVPITEQSITIGDLTNESDKALVVPAGAGLVVTGKVTGSETDPSKIVIKSDATTPSGSFFINNANACDMAVYATIDMYSKAKKLTNPITFKDENADSPDKGKEEILTHTWQYFGIPVTNINLSRIGTDLIKSTGSPVFWLRERKEERNDPNHFYRKWLYMNRSQALDAFWGYEITQNEPSIYIFKGKLNTCPSNITLTRIAEKVTAVSTTTDEKIVRHELGQNVVANSYTAAMDKGSLTFDDALDKTVYLCNTGHIADWQANKTDADRAGGFYAIPTEVCTPLWSASIPSMQGFMVKYKDSETTHSTDSRKLTFNYAGLQKNSGVQRAPAQDSERGGYLRVVVSSENSADAILLIEKSGTTAGFDNGFDGAKLDMPTTALFLPTKAGNMQVSVDKSIIDKYIAFKAGAYEEYTLTLTKDNLGGYSDLKLVDLATKTVVDLRGEETIYEFRPTIEGKHENRFLITRGDVDNETIAEQGYTMLNAYLDGTTLIVSNMIGEVGTMTLHDIAGRVLQTSSMRVNFSEFDMSSYPSGVYMVTLRAGSAIETIKVVVR